MLDSVVVTDSLGSMEVTLDATSIIAHAPHYLNHHSRSTLPQPHSETAIRVGNDNFRGERRPGDIACDSAVALR